LAQRKRRKVATKTRARTNSESQGNRGVSASKESIKAAEFGTVAAKTTSLALASIATGADKFSELVKQEALKSQKANAHKTTLVTPARNRKRAKRESKREVQSS